MSHRWETTGTVWMHRGPLRGLQCECCDGGWHIYSANVKLATDCLPDWYPSYVRQRPNPRNWIEAWLMEHKTLGIEGKRVRLTIELVDDEESEDAA